jgi:hypothetical protein
MAGTYKGSLVRAAHFAVRPAPAGLNADHFTPDPEPDPFNPQPDVPAGQAGTVWSDPQAVSAPPQSCMPNLTQQPVSHWYNGQAAVPTSVETATRMDAMADRMMIDHMDTNMVPDSIRLYQHSTEGQENQWIVGRMPVAAGATIPDGPLAGLQNGRNSYDATNGVTEVYSGDVVNVGRYRLGVKTNIFGLYESPIGKFGQEGTLRAYTGLSPQFPVDKPPMTNTAPYTPNSIGTAHSGPAQPNQVPSNFALPSETAITDFGTVTQGAGNDFADDGRLY